MKFQTEREDNADQKIKYMKGLLLSDYKIGKVYDYAIIGILMRKKRCFLCGDGYHFVWRQF